MGFEAIMMWIIAPVIATAAGGLGGWFFSRKRQRIDNIDAATDTFNKIIAQLRSELGIHAEEKDRNTGLIEKQSQQIKELTSEVHKLSKEVEGLRREKKENIILKKKIEKYESLLITHNIKY
ncbi:MAG: hypothetical protein FWC34_09010 [Bacteroidetes bacterium]|nr:hypothetical protein [Bacteroidota bacterium]